MRLGTRVGFCITAWGGWLIGAILAVVFAASVPANAQVFGGRGGGRLAERLAERLRQPPQESVAVAGSPFGVGRVTVQLPPDGGGAAPGALINSVINGGPAPDLSNVGNQPTVTLTEANGRVFYQAEVETPIRAAIREVLARPRSATVYFLFTGDDPLDLTLFNPSGAAQRVQVQHDAQLQQRLLAEWWKQYVANIERPNRSDNYPHVVDAYLTSMLANRLSLQPIEWPRGFLAEKLPGMDQTLGLALGTEPARLAVARDTMLRPSADANGALEALPPPVEIRMAPMPEEVGNIAIEPLAMHVPEECFYVRFAGFPNYQWFRSTLDQFGGDMRNMVSRRGVDYGLNARIERQLSLKESALSKVFGPTVIADIAMIGDDPFMREGAAIGMLFQAQVNLLLANDIRRNRSETMAANPDATETHLTIAGHDVSFLSTPDNRVRSFYAVDGDFHLVTTSRRIVERFYEAGAGTRPLSQATDFRNARGQRKPSDADAVFAYLSEAFFRQLASPSYQIEMMRRLRSATDIELVEMAQMAARNERKPAESIDQLIAGGFLPDGFSSAAHRPDGSQLILHPDGQITDSLRGGRGTFLPIPDVDVRGATASEVAAYQRFAQAMADGGTGPIGPTTAAVRRVATSEPGREQVTLDIRMLPLAENADKFVRPALGPAGTQRIAPLPGDVASLEISSSGNGFLKSFASSGGGGQPAHIFAGVLNAYDASGAGQLPGVAGTQLPGIVGKVLEGFSIVESLRWYIGGWPSPGGLQQLGVGDSNAQVDAEGFGFAKGLWQRQISTANGPITVASNKRDVVAEVAGGLNIVDTAQPAQIWLQIDDISNTRFAGLANQVGYMLARGVSRGNERFLHRMTTQLGVPPDQALDAGQKLLDARLISPIGGRFELLSGQGAFPSWSVATESGASSGAGVSLVAPAGYVSPPLDWFRGVKLYGGSDTRGLWAHAEVAMQRSAAEAPQNNSLPAPGQPRSVIALPPPPAPATRVPPPAVPIPSPPEPGPK